MHQNWGSKTVLDCLLSPDDVAPLLCSAQRSPEPLQSGPIREAIPEEGNRIFFGPQTAIFEACRLNQPRLVANEPVHTTKHQQQFSVFLNSLEIVQGCGIPDLRQRGHSNCKAQYLEGAFPPRVLGHPSFRTRCPCHCNTLPLLLRPLHPPPSRGIFHTFPMICRNYIA